MLPGDNLTQRRKGRKESLSWRSLRLGVSIWAVHHVSAQYKIPGFQGVWARHATLEGCRRELREALSDWIALRLRLGLPIPVIAGLDLNRVLQPA